MSKIILDPNDTISIGADSSDTSIYGGSGSEKVIVAATAGLIYVSQSVERTELSGASTAYSYLISGNNLLVKSGATTVATIIGGNGTKTIAFSDGSAPFAVTGVGVATLGGQSISASTAGTLTIPAAQLNTSDKSASAPVAATPIPSAGQTFTLTTGTDNLVGTAGDDKFNGVLQDAGATGTTTQPGDYITGGAGNDTLNISVAGTLVADYTISAVQTDGVEKVVLSNFETSANNTIVAADLMNNLATVGLASSSATGDTVFTGLKNLVAAEMRNGAADLTVTYNSDVVSGTTDSQTLTVSNISGGTFTANGAETIAVTTALVKSTLTDVVSDSVTKLTVDGTADLTLTNATVIKTIDANTLTGKLNITAGNANQLVTGGTSGDTFDLNTNLTSSDTINGGAGNDTLKLSVGNATIDVGTSASKQELYNVSNIEIIDIASTNDGATLDLTGTTGVSAVVAAANVKTVTFTGSAAAESNAATITFTLNGTSYTTAALDLSSNAIADVSAANTALKNKINLITGFTATAGTTGPVTITATTGEAVEIAVTDQTGATAAESAYSDVAFSNITTQSVDIYSGDAVTASLKDASGSADVLNVNLKTLSVDKGFAHSVGTITANNIESMNLSATGMSDAKITTVAALTGNAIKTLTITGDSDVTISSFTGSIALATIDASTSTGDINLAAAPAAIVQSIKTGTGNDTIDLGAYLTAADTIDGGANNATTAGTTGKDKLTASGNLGTSTVPVALNINNVETIEVSIGTTAATYINAAAVIGASSLAFSNDTSGGTVKITNLPATTVVGLGIGAVELGDTTTTTVDLALADATGSSDTITVDYSDSIDANNSVTLKIDEAIETLKVSASKVGAGTLTSTLVNTNNFAKSIVVTDGSDVTGILALGTLNAATTNVDASTYAGKLTVTTAATGAVTVSANGTVDNNVVTGAGTDTITLAGKLGTTVQTVNGSGGNDILNVIASDLATDFTSVSNVETINITIGGNTFAGFDHGTKDNGLNAATYINILGGDSLSKFVVGTAGVIDDAAKTIDASKFGGYIDITLAANALDADMTIIGSAATTDVVTTSVSTDTTGEVVKSMTGVETLVLNSVNADTDAHIDLTNVTGLTTLKATFVTGAAADMISVDKLASGVTVKAISATTGDNLIVDLTDKANSNNVLNLELTTFAAGTDSLNFDAAGVETLNITAKSAGLIDLGGVAPTSATGNLTVNVAGTAALTLKSLSSSTNVVNASTATGALTLDVSDRPSTLMTITGGEGADTIAMRNYADVLTGGLGTDTLKVSANLILGGIQVDLSATADQVVSFNGSSNSVVQTGFENVDVSGITGSYGADITGSKTTASIVGTPNGDQINTASSVTTTQAITGGLGADTITLGSHTAAVTLNYLATGTDTTNGTITSGSTNLSSSADVIYGAVNGDKLNFPLTTVLAGADSAGTALSAGLITLANSNPAASNIDIIRGTYASGIFTTGTGAGDNDYLVQVQDAEATSADTLSSVVLMDITGTVTFAATTAGLITLGVA